MNKAYSTYELIDMPYNCTYNDQIEDIDLGITVVDIDSIQYNANLTSINIQCPFARLHGQYNGNSNLVRLNMPKTAVIDDATGMYENVVATMKVKMIHQSLNLSTQNLKSGESRTKKKRHRTYHNGVRLGAVFTSNPIACIQRPSESCKFVPKGRCAITSAMMLKGANAKNEISPQVKKGMTND